LLIALLSLARNFLPTLARIVKNFATRTQVTRQDDFPEKKQIAVGISHDKILL
jgi:hypothetical protein